MKLVITKRNYKILLRGTSLFATGGGIPFVDQVQTINKLDDLRVSIFSPQDFSKDAHFCLAAELGSTDASPIKKTKVVSKMLHLLYKTTGKKIEAVYEPELGQESVLLETASLSNLPIVDFDLVGFRSVPRVDINIFRLKNIPFHYLPMIVGTDKGRIFVAKTKMSDEKLDETLRKMTSLSKNGSLFVVGGIVSVKKLIDNNITRSMLQRAYRYGEKKNKKTFLNSLQSKVSIAGYVVDRKPLKIKGFFAEVIIIRERNESLYKLVVLNEILFLLDEINSILYSIPDKILLIDPVKMIGLSASALEKGAEVLITVVDPEVEWRDVKAKRLFGQNRFQFLIDAAVKY